MEGRKPMTDRHVRFGITERGDIHFHNEWIRVMESGRVDAAIVISKGLPTKEGKEAMRRFSDRLIFHATTTGFGGTVLEPNVVPWKQRLDDLDVFCGEIGFRKDHVVIRIDPMVPTAKYLETAKSIVRRSWQLGFRRFRYSWMDTWYRHLPVRFAAAGVPVPPSVKEADVHVIQDWDQFMAKAEKHGCHFGSCAEVDRHLEGCVSALDFQLCGIDPRLASGHSGQRSTCACVGQKTEMLSHRGRCGHGCLYCFWRD